MCITLWKILFTFIFSFMQISCIWCNCVLLQKFVFGQVVTDCNDSARAMERTEQLHTIYNQLSFGKMKVCKLHATVDSFLTLYSLITCHITKIPRKISVNKA